MRIFLTVFIFSITSLVAFSQQERFIYLESGNKQPFYIKFDNKILNSAAAGYLIIPKLSDSTYIFTIGFVQNGTEKKFEYTIARKDAGFLIQNVDDRQWNLINLQTKVTLSPGEIAEKKANTSFVTEIQTDAFSVMLANAVHDSTILQRDVAAAPVLEDKSIITKDSVTANDTTQIVALNDTSTLKPAVKKKIIKASKAIHNTALLKKNIAKKAIPKNLNEPVIRDSSQITDTSKVIAISKPLVKQKPAKNIAALHDSVALKKAIAKKENLKKINNHRSDSIQNIIAANNVIKHASVIKREFIKNNEEGLELMYVDAHDKKSDTIRILILADSSLNKNFVADKAKADSVLPTMVVTDSVLHKDSVADKNKANSMLVSTPPPAVENNQIVKPDSSKIEIKTNTLNDTSKVETSGVSMINSDCKNFASDDDFLKLRKKMVAENDDEGMIRAAKKSFKTKCFTTEQIKNLSVLFLKDEGKYMFFDASYPFVSDTEKFTTLENQLSDNYYLTRFRAMIHK